ncbi:hypothetical protein AYO21_11740 [Fonsecaea monophora]|uniref:Uncharacterized protein n=1 Tax=Fonsecaea monophora TaxID=254056 RepID=A0A177ESY7_9EURO|nr:hypothetical protein AYO21_11740 [Fonsecaea monophora]OAG34099.1 hypothetical protein AYO21_11740 [Fonsecaea monophora]
MAQNNNDGHNHRQAQDCTAPPHSPQPSQDEILPPLPGSMFLSPLDIFLLSQLDDPSSSSTNHISNNPEDHPDFIGPRNSVYPPLEPFEPYPPQHHQPESFDLGNFPDPQLGSPGMTGTMEENDPEVGARLNPHHSNITDGDQVQVETDSGDTEMVDATSAGDVADGNGNDAEEVVPTILVGKDGPNVTIWSTFTGGQVTGFGRYEHGLRRPWSCLMCDNFVAMEKGKLQAHLRERHGLTGLRVMKVENENFSNFQGHDDQDCFVWGEYVRGDPLPWKCLLCTDHKGIKSGKGAFPRHFQKTHGIRVVLPPVTPEELRRHNDKRAAAAAAASP